MPVSHDNFCFFNKITFHVQISGHFPSPGPAGPGNFAGGQFGMPPGSPFHGPGPHPMQGGKFSCPVKRKQVNNMVFFFN